MIVRYFLTAWGFPRGSLINFNYLFVRATRLHNCSLARLTPKPVLAVRCFYFNFLIVLLASNDFIWVMATLLS